MRYPPLEVLASWPQPNYKNPVTRGPALMIVELAILPIALTCVTLRLWIRIRWLHKSWWDDWLMVAAAVSFPVTSDRSPLTLTRFSLAEQQSWSFWVFLVGPTVQTYTD